MKEYIKILFYALIAIIFFWLLDAFVDSAVHHEETFTESLFLNRKEAAYRLLFSLCFIAFSIIVARIVIRLKTAENELEIALAEQRQTGDRFSFSETYLKSIIEAVSDCIMLVSPDCEIIEINPAGMAMIGEVERDKVVGKKLCPFVGTEFHEAFWVFIKGVCEGRAGTFSYQLADKAGNIRWLESSGVPFVDKPNNRTLMLAVTRDVTQGKQAEKSLKESHERFTTVLDSIDSVVYVADLDTYEVLFVNRYARDKFGDVVGKPCWQAFQTGMAGPCPFCTNEKIVDSEGNPAGLLVREAHCSVDDRWYSIFDRAIPWTDGRFVRLEIAFDITDSRRTMQELKQAHEDKAMLLREIHHRVKNNLAVIQSLLKLQSQQIKDKESRGRFLESQQRVKTMALIHEQLYGTEDLSSLNVQDYFRRLVDMLFRAYAVDAEKIKKTVEIADVRIDVNVIIPLALISNELITNALKYAFPGAEKGELFVGMSAGENDTFTLVVRDDGVGIAKDFDIHCAKSLGMRIVTSLTKQIQGTLTINRDSGTEFRITANRNPLLKSSSRDYR